MSCYKKCLNFFSKKNFKKTYLSIFSNFYYVSYKFGQIIGVLPTLPTHTQERGRVLCVRKRERQCV